MASGKSRPGRSSASRDGRRSTIGTCRSAGFLADIKANRKVNIEFGVDVADDRVLITGCLKPAVADVPITAEITDEGGKWMYLYAATDQRGCFDKSKHEVARLPPGRYVVQIFVTAGGDAAEIASEARPVEVKSP